MQRIYGLSAICQALLFTEVSWGTCCLQSSWQWRSQSDPASSNCSVNVGVCSGEWGGASSSLSACGPSGSTVKWHPVSHLESSLLGVTCLGPCRKNCETGKHLVCSAALLQHSLGSPSSAGGLSQSKQLIKIVISPFLSSHIAWWVPADSTWDPSQSRKLEFKKMFSIFTHNYPMSPNIRKIFPSNFA